MEMNATPSTIEVITSLDGIVAGSEATSAMDSAPLIPPSNATFFQDFGIGSPLSLEDPSRGQTDEKRALATAVNARPSERTSARIVATALPGPWCRTSRGCARE